MWCVTCSSVSTGCLSDTREVHLLFFEMIKRLRLHNERSRRTKALKTLFLSPNPPRPPRPPALINLNYTSSLRPLRQGDSITASLPHSHQIGPQHWLLKGARVRGRERERERERERWYTFNDNCYCPISIHCLPSTPVAPNNSST